LKCHEQIILKFALNHDYLQRKSEIKVLCNNKSGSVNLLIEEKYLLIEAYTVVKGRKLGLRQEFILSSETPFTTKSSQNLS